MSGPGQPQVGSFSRQALSLVLLLGGCGHESSVVEDSLDMLVVPDAAGRSTDAATDAGLGTLKGSMVLTYYWVTMQADYTGPNDTVICDAKALSLATVPLAFAQALALEGTGRLSDGRLLNVSGACTCSSGMHTCYSVLDPLKYPFGEGVGSRALRPYRSIAVDRSFFAIGTKLYVPELLGEPMPQSYGFVHDGCLSADDVGGGIVGAHIDWFVAEKANYRTLDSRLQRSSVTAYVSSPRCP